MKKKLNFTTKTARKDFLASLINDEKVEATPYDKNNNYEIGDFISHEKFGLGFIHNILSNTKIEVFFEDSEKVMLQNWQ